MISIFQESLASAASVGNQGHKFAKHIMRRRSDSAAWIMLSEPVLKNKGCGHISRQPLSLE
jgi:hypothetical protein